MFQTLIPLVNRVSMPCQYKYRNKKASLYYMAARLLASLAAMLISRRLVRIVCKGWSVLLFLGLLISVWMVQRNRSSYRPISRLSIARELTDGNRLVASSKPTYDEVANSWKKQRSTFVTNVYMQISTTVALEAT